MLWLLLLITIVVAFVGLTIELREFLSGEIELIGRIDNEVLKYFVENRRSGLTGSAIDLTALGSSTSISIIVIVVSLFLIFTKSYGEALSLVSALFGSGLLSWLLKTGFERARPELKYRLVEVDSFSYPSGHSLGAASVYLMLAIILSKNLSSVSGKSFITAALLLLVLFIGISRMYLGVHYFSDVIGGFLIGFAWTISIVLIQKIYSEGSLWPRKR